MVFYLQTFCIWGYAHFNIPRAERLEDPETSDLKVQDYCARREA